MNEAIVETVVAASLSLGGYVAPHCADYTRPETCNFKTERVQNTPATEYLSTGQDLLIRVDSDETITVESL